MNTQNNTRSQIITLLDQAESSVEIAVSWLTDEILINKLTEVVKNKKVVVLLSRDPLNVFRYNEIRALQRKGAVVKKCGVSAPGQGGFMHAKFMIIDEKVVHGGSFNFTAAANHNFENFNKYDSASLQDFKLDFMEWMKSAYDYNDGFEDAELVKSVVIDQFKENENFRLKMLENIDKGYMKISNNDISERENLLKNEIEKEELRGSIKSIQCGSVLISKQGELTQNEEGVKSKPHRFYGGSMLKTQFTGQKLSNSYGAAHFQMRELNCKFPFIRTRIVNDTLICTGIISLYGNLEYNIKIEFRSGTFPRVFITNKIITPIPEIHMYKEGILCLFYPIDLKWKPGTSIAENIIPWVFEWIILYELYKITGKWEAEAVSHTVMPSI